jgi:putative ABC transport system permease protein
MEALKADLRFGVRLLGKNRGLTTTALVILSLGIGASVVVLAIVNAVLIRPLPYKDVSGLVVVRESDPYIDPYRVSWGNVAPADLAEWKSMSDVFEQIGAYHNYRDLNLTGSGEPELVSGARVTANLFPLLGVGPALGRYFSEEEDQKDERVLILSDGLWRRRFSADPGILGKTLTLSGRLFTVVGVMPPEFKPFQGAEIWTPMGFSDAEWKQRDYFLNVIARLKANTTLRQAQLQMSVLADGLQRPYVAATHARGVAISPLSEHLVEGVRPALLILLAAVSLVLCITCANVANLLLSHFAAREKEIAIRIALGADRLRILRQLVTESLLLSLVGGAMGCVLAGYCVSTLTRIDPGYIPRFADVRIDWRVLAFGLAISLLTGVSLGVFSAIRATPRLAETLKATAQYSSRGSGAVRLRTVLVTTELALAVTLLIGTGLLVKSFVRLLRVDPGFNPKNLLALQIKLSPATYRTGGDNLAFQRELVQRTSLLPGVRSVAISSHLPFTDLTLSRSFAIEGFQNDGAEELLADFSSVSPNFFETMGTSLLRGRHFTEADTPESTKVIVINESMSQRFFPTGIPWAVASE